MRVNLLVPMRLVHLVLPWMIARGQGHILNVASLAGVGGLAFAEAYCSSKHGLVGFSRSLRFTVRAGRLQQAKVGEGLAPSRFTKKVRRYSRPSALASSFKLCLTRWKRWRRRLAHCLISSDFRTERGGPLWDPFVIIEVLDDTHRWIWLYRAGTVGKAEKTGKPDPPQDSKAYSPGQTSAWIQS